MAVNIIFFLLCLEGVIISLNLGAIAALLPSIAESLNISSFQAANIIPFYMIPYGAGALLYAPLIKTLDIKYIKIISLFVFGLFSFFCGMTQNLDLLIVSRIFSGVSAASVIPLAIYIIGKIIPANERGRSVGLFFSTAFISSLIGVFLSGFVPWRWLFFLPAILSGASAILIFILFPEKINKKEKISIDYLRVFKVTRIRRILIYIFFLSLLYHASYNWLGVYFSQRYNFNQLQISSFLTLVALSGALGQIVGGNLTDKLGRVKSCSLGLFLFSLSLITIAFRAPFFILTICLIIFGFGWTINHNSLVTMLTDFPERIRSELASLNSALRYVSGGLGASLSGFFMQKSFAFSYLVYGLILFSLALSTTKILQENK